MDNIGWTIDICGVVPSRELSPKQGEQTTPDSIRIFALWHDLENPLKHRMSH